MSKVHIDNLYERHLRVSRDRTPAPEGYKPAAVPEGFAAIMDAEGHLVCLVPDRDLMPEMLCDILEAAVDFEATPKFPHPIEVREADLAVMDGMAWWHKHDPGKHDPNWGRACACGGAIPAGWRMMHVHREVRHG